jgi:cytochrome c-type biogenesis protein CcmH/NrfF
MLSILLWWCIPVAAVILASVVLGVVRWARRSHNEFDSMHSYRRFRQALERDRPRVR